MRFLIAQRNYVYIYLLTHYQAKENIPLIFNSRMSPGKKAVFVYSLEQFSACYFPGSKGHEWKHFSLELLLPS